MRPKVSHTKHPIRNITFVRLINHYEETIQWNWLKLQI